MQQFRMSRVLGTAVLSLGVLALGGCLGDDDPVDPQVTDGDVIAVALMLNSEMVSIAELAETRAEAQAVIDFGADLDATHTASGEALADMDITPRQSNVSAFLSQQEALIRNELTPLTGATFDSEWIDVQVELHEQGIDIIENVLMPEVEDATLEAELQSMLSTFEANLIVAQGIQGGLGGT